MSITPSPHSSASHASRSSRQHRHATFEVSCVLMFSARCCCCYKYEPCTSCGHSGRGESHNAKNVLVVRTVAGTVQNQCEGRRCFHCWCWSPTWSQPLSDLTIGAGSILLFTSRTWSWSWAGVGATNSGRRMRHYLEIYSYYALPCFLSLFPICCPVLSLQSLHFALGADTTSEGVKQHKAVQCPCLVLDSFVQYKYYKYRPHTSAI